MDASSLEALVARVSRLENENRRLRRGGAVALLLLACVGMLATNGGRHARQVEAERFLVKDSHGVARAAFGVTRDGQPELVLRDENGDDQILFHANSDSTSSFEIYQRGRLQALLSGTASGPMLQLFDERGRLASSLYAWSGGTTGLALNQAQGGLDLGVDRDGAGRVRFSDPGGSIRGGWSFDANGEMLAHHREPSNTPMADSLQAIARPAFLDDSTPIRFGDDDLGVSRPRGRGPAL